MQQADALIYERVCKCLSEADDGRTVDDVVSETELSRHRVEDALEVLTRERYVAVDQHEDCLVFSIDVELTPGIGGERLEIGAGDRIFEVSAVQTPKGRDSVRVLEKRRWSPEYEHTVGGIVIPCSTLDMLFSMMNLVDERIVYESEESA